MSREIRADYEQTLMFPPSVEDWIGEDHPARFIRDFVDSLDLPTLGFHERLSDTGRPNYGSDLLLKVWLYGYVNGIRSTRKLERACLEHMGLIWLTGMNSPDHNSLWRFWRDNKKGLKDIFKQTVRVALRADLIGLVIHALDGTKITVRSSRQGAMRKKDLEKLLKELDSSVEKAMDEVERSEKKEAGQYRLPASMRDQSKRKEIINRALAELEESGKELVNPQEPEASFMKSQRTVELSYNAQVVADKINGLIVACDVIKEGNDNAQLVPMLDQVNNNIGKVATENVADAGYYCGTQIGLADQRGYAVLTNPPGSEKGFKRSPEANPYHSSFFKYDEVNDCCVCPHGHKLTYCQVRIKGRNKNISVRYQCRDYKQCSYRWKCSPSKHGRVIGVDVNYKAIDKQRSKRKDPEKIKALKMRMAIVEPVFAWIKHHMAFDRWTVFGLESAKVQWALVCTAINLKKLYKNWKIQRLVFSSKLT